MKYSPDISGEWWQSQRVIHLNVIDLEIVAAYCKASGFKFDRRYIIKNAAIRLNGAKIAANSIIDKMVLNEDSKQENS